MYTFESEGPKPRQLKPRGNSRAISSSHAVIPINRVVDSNHTVTIHSNKQSYHAVYST